MLVYLAEDAPTVATSTDITNLLNVLKAVFTFLIEQLSTIVDVIMANPLLLIPIGITLTYVIVRIFRTIFRLA